MHIDIGITSDKRVMSLPLKLANRHGLVTGATGTGKSVTLQTMAEQFSKTGVPVFAADVKGDLSGMAGMGDPQSAIANATRKMKRRYHAKQYPVAFWDIFGIDGLPIQTSVQEMGADLLSRMLRLNPTQDGAMMICFKKAEEEGGYMLTLDDLRWSLNDMLENREDVCRKYGNVTASSISAIQRNLLALESQGGDKLFGEPSFDIMEFMQLDSKGRGVINLLHADTLMEAPWLYATFLLWLLTELFSKLPECGDLDKPKLVFFFDEAHLLFDGAPRVLVQSIERLVRLVRSKGVGVFFVTQTPKDVPDAILAQLGNRIQHALRAYTPKDQRFVKAAADAFRPNPDVNVKEAITTMGVGEALISMMDDEGVPQPVERVRIIPPSAHVGPVEFQTRVDVIGSMPAYKNYNPNITPEKSAYDFARRMKLDRGIDPGEYNVPEKMDEDWVQQYVPDFSEVPPPEDGRTLWGTVFQLSAIVFWLGIGYFGLNVAHSAAVANGYL